MDIFFSFENFSSRAMPRVRGRRLHWIAFTVDLYAAQLPHKQHSPQHAATKFPAAPLPHPPHKVEAAQGQRASKLNVSFSTELL